LLAIVAGGGIVTAAGSDDSRPTREPSWTLDSGAQVTLFPAGDPFPVYVADPHRPANALLFRMQIAKRIPDTSTRRTALSAGGRFGMLRFDTANQRAWQVSLDAGIDALFATDHSDEALGWDGNYGLTITTASNGPWSFKIALLHVSAHLGDEYEDRMHRTRIDYTREELAVGAGFRPAAGWRVYGEMGHAYLTKDPGQAPWRVQQGVEFEGPGMWGGRFAAYAAADLGEMQERAWRIDRTYEGGLVAHSAGRSYRLLLQYANGRPPIAEFFKFTETTLTYGLRIDF
jgi:hypothetical protein